MNGWLPFAFPLTIQGSPQTKPPSSLARPLPSCQWETLGFLGRGAAPVTGSVGVARFDVPNRSRVSAG